LKFFISRDLTASNAEALSGGGFSGEFIEENYKFIEENIEV